MLKHHLLAALCCVAALPLTAQADEVDRMIDAFHEYNIKGCDHVIRQEMNLDAMSNWAFNISKHAGGLDGNATEAKAVVHFGQKNDTVRKSLSIIQTPKYCSSTVELLVILREDCAQRMADTKGKLSVDHGVLESDFYTTAGGGDAWTFDVPGTPYCAFQYQLRNRAPRMGG